MLESGSPPNSDVERELLQGAATRVRKRGYGALDLSPRYSGGETVAERQGFAAIWDTCTFSGDAAKVPKPKEEFTTRFLAGEYGALQGLLLLNHREPARWRFETLAALWPAAEVAGLQDAMKLVAVAVQPADGAGLAIMAARREWLDPSVAEVDVWIHPAELNQAARVESAFAIAAEIARRLGTQRVETYGPPSAETTLKGLGLRVEKTAAPWLRWTF